MIEHDRYRSVGLAGNPFSIEVHDSEDGIIDGSWFVDRGIAPPPPPGSKTLVQVIGDQGVGKSTHLHHWTRERPGPYHYIPRSPYRARWQQPPVGPLVYGDEIDRMPRSLRRRWFRQLAAAGSTVVIGTHADLSRLGRRVGFEIRTHRLGPVDCDQLEVILNRRIDAVTLPGHQSRFRFSGDEISTIFELCEGNLRAADSASHRTMARRLNRQLLPNLGNHRP